MSQGLLLGSGGGQRGLEGSGGGGAGGLEGSGGGGAGDQEGSAGRRGWAVGVGELGSHRWSSGGCCSQGRWWHCVRARALAVMQEQAGWPFLSGCR